MNLADDSLVISEVKHLYPAFPLEQCLTNVADAGISQVIAFERKLGDGRVFSESICQDARPLLFKIIITASGL